MLKKLFNRKNILSTFSLAIGLTGLFGLPQELGVSTEQLIIGLVTLVGVELIVVNIGYLEGLENSIEEVASKVSLQNLDSVIAPRRNRFELTEYVDIATEVVVTGIALETIIMSQSNIILQLISKGVPIKFIVIDPKANFLKYIDYGMPNHTGDSLLKSNIRAGLARIAQIYNSVTTPHQNLLEAKVYEGIPFFSSVRISTYGNRKDALLISFYSYGGATGERKSIVCLASESPDLYSYYSQSIDNLVNASRLVDLKNYTF